MWRPRARELARARPFSGHFRRHVLLEPLGLARVPPPHPLSRFISSARDPIADASAADPLDDVLASQCGTDAAADEEEVARVCAAVEAAPEDKIVSTLADMGVDFNEPLLTAVLLATKRCSCKKLVSLCNYAAENNRAAKSLSTLEVLVRKVAASDEID
ncbi:hypothetical protein BS78_01G498500 [Paspalum vaginatum]|nr:hypothetical protein BS78_01G498500 [Paspalum vaginatum]